MLYLALLPLLAISTALAGPMRRGRVQADSEKTDTNRQHFLDTITGEKPDDEIRRADFYGKPGCNTSVIDGLGYDMEDRKTIFTPWLGSLMPGKNVGTSSMDSKGQVAGTFCLSMYKTDEQGRQCIVNSKVFKIDLDHPPKCIDIDQDADYAAFSFEKTYDYYPKCPTGCYDPADMWAPGL